MLLIQGACRLRDGLPLNLRGPPRRHSQLLHQHPQVEPHCRRSTYLPPRPHQQRNPHTSHHHLLHKSTKAIRTALSRKSADQRSRQMEPTVCVAACGVLPRLRRHNQPGGVRCGRYPHLAGDRSLPEATSTLCAPACEGLWTLQHPHSEAHPRNRRGPRRSLACVRLRVLPGLALDLGSVTPMMKMVHDLPHSDHALLIQAMTRLSPPLCDQSEASPNDKMMGTLQIWMIARTRRGGNPTDNSSLPLKLTRVQLRKAAQPQMSHCHRTQ